MNEGDTGFCHLRQVQDGTVVHKYGEKAVVRWYFDPLPTNCVADWVCPVQNQKIDQWNSRLKNLAVFYGSCNSDCLFCQNTSYRQMMAQGEPMMTPQELAGVADENTACVCYFGGDPSCNAKHSITVSRLLNENRQVRVCYETNGKISRKYLNDIADIVLQSGGTIKFDLKAMTSQVYQALTGTSNEAVIRNFRILAEKGFQSENTFLVASILLIPGYVGLEEVRRIASFVAECDSSIPTALLGFQPHHVMSDLPRTSRKHAEAAKKVAEEEGLTNVRIGNRGLLSLAEYNYQ
jgi:pyruvate formate lyase activating enzyme